MFVQTLNTPNPNSLKFLPGEKVSLSGSVEFTNKNETSNELIRNIFSIDGVIGIFLSDDFLSINKKPEKKKIVTEEKRENPLKQTLDKKLEDLSKELEKETDHDKQQAILKSINSVLEMIDKIKEK